MGRDAFGDDDPLARAIAPPPNETDEERRERVAQEVEAKRRSDEIDVQLQAEKNALKKKKKPVKVLLLGQSESGKSTTLKNFQISFCPNAWAEEKSSWRCVIQLNITRTVNAILDKLNGILDQSASGSSSPVVVADALLDDDDDFLSPEPTLSRARAGSTGSNYSLSMNHQRLVRRLGPLREIQRQLERRLGKSSLEETYDSGPSVSFSASGRRPSQEFFVRTPGWKAKVKGVRKSKEALDAYALARAHDDDEVTQVIRNCREDIASLWGDDIVKRLIRSRKLVLLDSSEYYMRNIDRIARKDYTPSNEDVVRARLRTVGVQEHHLTFESGPDTGSEWIVYDVGGARSSRVFWPSYFDDMSAIIFLAPINVFDEQLAEDRHVNRLEDSTQLWKILCSNKLLKNTELVLFLNKCDLLDKKLKSGVKIVDTLPGYGERANDQETFANFMKSRFGEIFKQNTKTPRKLHTHLTSVVDTTATAITVSAVHDSILKLNLKRLELI